MHIYYGDGQGKTTAAVGLAFRCANRGKRVLFTSFLKRKDSGEFLSNTPFETDNFDFCNKFWYDLSEDEKNMAKTAARDRLTAICNCTSKYDMIVFDELLDAVTIGCVDLEFSVEVIRKIYGKSEIVITGHQRVEELFEMADYITEMKKEKHPFDTGIEARCGIEF